MRKCVRLIVASILGFGVILHNQARADEVCDDKRKTDPNASCAASASSSHAIIMTHPSSGAGTGPADGGDSWWSRWFGRSSARESSGADVATHGESAGHAGFGESAGAHGGGGE